MCPTRDEGTLTSLGLCSGSKLELKVNTIFISVQVRFPNGSRAINVRCSPHETFQDLAKKLEMEGEKRKLGKVIFAMEERVFDPDQDKAPLREYGITHGSILEMRRDRTKSNEPGGEADVNKDEDDDIWMREKDGALIERLAEMRLKGRTWRLKLPIPNPGSRNTPQVYLRPSPDPRPPHPAPTRASVTLNHEFSGKKKL